MEQPSIPTRTEPWDEALTSLRGVGAERSVQLARLGLRTVGDLLLHRPRRYEDRRRVLRIADLQLNQSATVRGQIVALGTKRFAQGRKSVFEIILEDGSARLHCRWWNLPYMRNYFQTGEDVLVFGRLLSLKPRTMDHPESENVLAGVEPTIHLNRIAPVYPLTEGLPQRWLRALIWNVLDQFGQAAAEPWSGALLPESITRAKAIQTLHFPPEMEDAESARQRLALDELIELQSTIQRRRQNLLARAEGCPCPGDNHLIKPFLAQLGFQLTRAQTEVLREMRADLSSGRPMRRLLQGDVGSGKTVVAACCALLAIESRCSVALMAPTEILAEQHFQTFLRWFKPLAVPVHLHTGSRKTQRPFSGGGGEADLELNQPSLVVGTHALVESAFVLENLGLVIIDEQHRFGVEQREKLVRKGACPHLLVMTATPIPRTLGLTIYGDLDVSVIRELPAGRSPIKTFVRTEDRLAKVWAFIQAKLEAGRQAFVVFPRIEDTGQGLKAVAQEFETLQKQLAPFRVGLLHGRLSVEEKEATMSGFRAREIHVLLSTSLIEVGIDIPNATVMLIENADQFGLAQLHQLRGRIGRGTHESYCILISRAKTSDAEERLQILANTSDGFQIAEEDLKLRGAGNMLGQEQSGLPPFKFADLVEDFALVQKARSVAAELRLNPPRATKPACLG